MDPIGGSNIISTITDSFTTFITGIGSGIVTFFQELFTNADGSITVFAIVALSFIGLGIATGIVGKLLGKF